MKKMLLALGLMVGIAQSPLTADNCCPTYDCCENDCCIDWCDGWTVYGDYLYWNVRKCNLDYAVQVNEAKEYAYNWIYPTGKLYAVDPNYTGGFRVGVSKTLCNGDIGVRYTYLRHPIIVLLAHRKTMPQQHGCSLVFSVSILKMLKRVIRLTTTYLILK